MRLHGQGEYWRLLTSMLVHADFFHLLFNMVALLIFGNYAERLLSSPQCLLIYFASGLIANLIAWGYAHTAQRTDYIALGASGAVLGIIAADGVLMARIWRYARNPMALLFLRQVMVILMLQLIVDLIVVHNSLLHHAVGALSGALLCFWLTHNAAPQRTA